MASPRRKPIGDAPRPVPRADLFVRVPFRLRRQCDILLGERRLSHLRQAKDLYGVRCPQAPLWRDANAPRKRTALRHSQGDTPWLRRVDVHWASMCCHSGQDSIAPKTLTTWRRTPRFSFRHASNSPALGIELAGLRIARRKAYWRS
jgi:hypothetical protein